MTKNNRANGGIARALKLSPEKRKEIAQKAAASRWKNHQKIEKEPFGKIKGVSSRKDLTAIMKVSLKNLNIVEVEIVENTEVIRKFNEQPLEQAQAKIEGYVNALQDLGIEVEIKINKVANMEL